MMYTNGTNKRAKGREKTKILSPNEINNAQHKFDSKHLKKIIIMKNTGMKLIKFDQKKETEWLKRVIP